MKPCRSGTCVPTQPSSMTAAISYRIAHFISLGMMGVIDYEWVIDSFDAAEQMFGCSLDAYDGDRVDGNLVTV